MDTRLQRRHIRRIHIPDADKEDRIAGIRAHGDAVFPGQIQIVQIGLKVHFPDRRLGFRVAGFLNRCVVFIRKRAGTLPDEIDQHSFKFVKIY